MGRPPAGRRLWRRWRGGDREVTQWKSGPGKEPRQLLCRETERSQSRALAEQSIPRRGAERGRAPLSKRGVSVPVNCPPTPPTPVRFPTAPARHWQKHKHAESASASNGASDAVPLTKVRHLRTRCFLCGGVALSIGGFAGRPLTPLFPFQAEQRLRPGQLRPGGGCWEVGECQILRVRSPASPVPLNPVVLQRPKRPFTFEL